MNGLLKIENVERLKGFGIGGEFMVAKMFEDRSVYRIHLNDMNGVHKRDLKLHRFPTKNLYRLHYGNYYVGLPKDTIEDINLFLTAIEKLIKI